MKNLTLSIDEAVLTKVRLYAARRNTSVNRIVREHLERLASLEQNPNPARDRLLKLMDESPGRMGPDWKWRREDAYEGRVLPGHQHTPLRRTGKS